MMAFVFVVFVLVLSLSILVALGYNLIFRSQEIRTSSRAWIALLAAGLLLVAVDMSYVLGRELERLPNLEGKCSATVVRLWLKPGEPYQDKVDDLTGTLADDARCVGRIDVHYPNAKPIVKYLNPASSG